MNTTRRSAGVLTGFQRTAEGELDQLVVLYKVWDTYGQSELMRMPSLACTIANSLVMARTPPWAFDQNYKYNQGFKRNMLPLTQYLQKRSSAQ